jgi:hypothetical protein
MAAVRALIGSFFCLSGGTNLFVPAKFSTSAEQVAA